MARSCPVSSSCQYHGKFWKQRTCVILKKALGLGGGLYENRPHTQVCLSGHWSYSHKAQPLWVKSNVNSVEVHPQLSNNGPPVDGALGGSGFTASWRCQGTNVLAWKRIVWNQILLSMKAKGKNIKPRNPSSFSSQRKREVHQISNEATPFDVNKNFTSVLDQSLEAHY